MNSINDIWENVTGDYDRETGGERWIRRLDSDCWISVLHRLTGFGYHEWETAIVFKHEVTDRPRTWKDQDCLIISGDRREELNHMPKEDLKNWYEQNIRGNRNSMDTLIDAIKETNGLNLK